MGLTLGHGAWQIDQQSNGSMWNSYNFQPVGQWMGYSFTDPGAEGCCRSLNALLWLSRALWYNYWLYFSCIEVKIFGHTIPMVNIIRASFLFQTLTLLLGNQCSTQQHSIAHSFVMIEMEHKLDIECTKTPNISFSCVNHWGVYCEHFQEVDIITRPYGIKIYHSSYSLHVKILGWVGLWGFLWWAPSAKRKHHHGVSSDAAVWHRSNTGLSGTQYEQIPIILRVWPFWLTPFGQLQFGGLMVQLYFLYWNCSLSSGWHIFAA